MTLSQAKRKIYATKSTGNLEKLIAKIYGDKELTEAEITQAEVAYDATKERLMKVEQPENVSDEEFEADAIQEAEALHNTESLADVLRVQMENFPNVTLRKISRTTGKNYNKLLKAARKPQEDKPYDPKDRNYAAIAFVLGAEAIEDLDWLELNLGGRGASSKPGVSRSSDRVYEAGEIIRLRDNITYTIMFSTPNHLILMPHTENGTPRVLSHATFMTKGPKEVI